MSVRWRGSFSPRSFVSGIAARATLLGAARVLLLSMVVAGGWCVATNRLGVRAWQTPLDYSGDSLVVLARIHSAAQGHYWPLLPKRIPELGAPFTATWDGHPTSEDWLYTLSGLAARVLGLGAAANLAVLVSFVLAGLSAYAACRLLRCRPEWSFLCALGFAWSPYAFFRGLGHVMLAYDWVVPLGIVVGIWLAARDDLLATRSRWAFALLVAFATGWHNNYYTFLFLQWVGLAAVVRVARERRWRTLLSPAVIAGTAGAGWFLANVDSLPFLLAHAGETTSLTRSRALLAVYALRPLSLLVPLPGHRSVWWSDWGARYRMSGEPSNEAHYSYLGLVGIGALLWLAGRYVLRLLRRSHGPWPAQGWLVLWLLLFSVAGGINDLLGIAGMTLFRSTNRYSIAILALVLLFLAERLSEASERWPVWRRLLTFALLGLLMVWDQVPRRTPAAVIEAVATRLASDRAFVAAQQQRISPGGMVFQSPVSQFPETGHDHLRPYLHAHGLRFSYGGGPADVAAGWQRELERQTLGETIADLERYGFAAIQLNRAAFGDRGRRLIEELRRIGRAQAIESPAGDLVSILLRPSPQPALPETTVTFARGFYPAERDGSGREIRWTSGSALMRVYNTTGAPLARRLSFTVSTLAPRRLLLRHGHVTLVDTPLAPGQPRRFERVPLTLAAGVTRLDWLTEEPPSESPGPDGHKQAIMVHDLRLTASD